MFAAITVVPAMLAAAWLLPGFPLLLAGRFFAPPMVFMFAPLAVGLCYFALRQLPATWPGFRPRPAGAPKSARKPVPWWTVAATVAVAAAFAAWQIAEHTQQIIFLRDPATYLQVGYWIAHHGSLPITGSPDAFGAGPHTGLSFASVNYYPRGSGIVPQFMTGMPIVVAAAIWLGEVPAALVITPLIGACAVLSFAGLAGRLVGARWAPAAAAVLALSLPEIYTSRSTFSEPLAQVLLFGGLCLLTDALMVARTSRAHRAARANRAERAEHGEHDEHAEHGTRRTDWPGQDAVLAGLAGLALGLTVLVRLDALSDILPAVPFLGLLLAARRQRRLALPFALGLLIGVGYGLADGYLRSRPYLDLEAPSLRPLALIAAAVALLTVAVLIIARIRPAAAWLRRWLAPRLLRWLPAAAAAVTVLIFVGFAIRPLVQTVAGETDPTSIAYVAELQKLAHLPINGRRQYYEQSLYWVIWYIGVPAVLLGAFGLAVLARRGTRALLTWKDPDADGPRLGAAAADRDLGHRVRAVAPRGRARPALGEPAPGAVRAAGADPRRDLGLRLAEGTGRPARPRQRNGSRGRDLLRGLDGHPDRADHVRHHQHGRARDGLPPHRRRRADRGPQPVRRHRPELRRPHPRLPHRGPVRPAGQGHVRHANRDADHGDARHGPGRGGRHTKHRPHPGAAGRDRGRTHPVRRRAARGREPADHPGGARAHLAAHAHLAHPLHGVDVHPGRAARLTQRAPRVARYPPRS